jgi:CBS domain-containing protein
LAAARRRPRTDAGERVRRDDESMFATADARRVPRASRFDEALRDVMRPGVIVITENASVAQAQRALVAHGVHAILVLDRQGRPLGWATSRSLLGFSDRDTGLLSARDAVTEKAVTLEPSATVREALDVMRDQDVARVLVAHAVGHLPEGVVAEHDLLAVLAR